MFEREAARRAATSTARHQANRTTAFRLLRFHGMQRKLNQLKLLRSTQLIVGA